MTKKDTKSAATTTVHLVLQGKGGVGKSMISAILGQYLQETSSKNIACYDTDPQNPTFSRYKKIGAKILPLLKGAQVDRRAFDTLMEEILTAKDTTYVIDSGTTTFLPLASYIVENSIYELFADAGIDAVTHCVITGGQAMTDTLVGLNALAETAYPNSVCIWKNEYWGPIETHEGVKFEDMPVFKNHTNKWRGLVTIPERARDTFGADINKLVEQYMTFEEGRQSTNFRILEKSRLNTIQKDLYEQLRHTGLQ